MLDGMTIVFIVFGFFAFCLLVFGIVIWILWSRRGLTFIKFLDENGQWNNTTWKTKELGKTIDYDGQTYKFDITKCTRDKHNRPQAHYYVGNPEQCKFDYSKGNKVIYIDTKEITPKDFKVLMLSKVLKDIFSDDEVMMLLYIVMGLVVLVGIIIAIIIYTHTGTCSFDPKDTVTSEYITQACKNAFMV